MMVDMMLIGFSLFSSSLLLSMSGNEWEQETVMIFLGSLVAAAAVEESNLHQRIALKVLLLFGTSPKWLLLGFMTNTMFLSMWIRYEYSSIHSFIFSFISTEKILKEPHPFASLVFRIETFPSRILSHASCSRSSNSFFSFQSPHVTYPKPNFS